MFLLGSVLIKKFLHDYKVDQDIKGLQEEISRLEKTNNEFNQLIDYLNSEQFVEGEARITMGLGQEGEKAIIIPPNEEKIINGESDAKKDLIVIPSTSFGLPEEEKSEGSNPIKWWRYFFKK